MKHQATKGRLLCGAALALLTVGAAHAQDTAPSSDASTSVDAVVVTGSSIRGVAPVGSALIGISRDQIQAVAPSNVTDLLATIPALGNFGTNAEQSTPNRFRTTGYVANIHNLGIYATLTLLNSHRVALTGTAGSFPDPSAVPTIAIQRTEMIADGASAIYGSDATAGVVNFIYRKPFDGVEASATYSFDDGTRYEKRNFGIIGGHTWDWGGGGGVMLAYEHSDNKSPLNTDIDFLALGGDQRSRGGRDLRGTNCLTPTIRRSTVGGAPSGPTYGSSALNFTTTAADQRCGVLTPSTIIGDGNRNAVLLTANQQLTNNVKGWVEMNYSHYVAHSFGARSNFTLTVPRTNPFFTAGNIPPALFNDPTVQYVAISRSGNGLFPLLGRSKSGSSTVTTAVAGLDIDLGRDWKGTLSLDVSRTRDFNGTPGSLLDTVNAQTALSDTNPATAFNVFGQAAQNNPATLAKIDNGSAQTNWGQQGLQVLEFKADGPLMELPGGTLRAAVGASFTASQMNQLQLGGSRSPTAGFDAVVRNDHQRQQVEAAYFEINAPIVGDKNAMPGIRQLTVSISGRYDQYDQYGGTFNPKFGVVWAPIADLKFHASTGKNFNAPNVSGLTGHFAQPAYNINTNATIGYGPYKGILLNNVSNYGLAGHSDNLKPEHARTYSVGGDYTPSWLPGLHVGLNWYHVNYRDLFFKVTGTDPITNEAFSSLIVFFPTAEQTAQFIAKYPPATPVLTSNFDYIINTETINLGSRIQEGIDYDIGYRFQTDSFGAFNVSFSGVQQLKFDQKVLSTQKAQSRLKTTDAVKWKTRTSLGWNYGGLTLNGFLNYTGSYYNVSVSPFQRVKPNKTVDLTAAYEFKDVGISYLKGVTLQARVANLFDKDPPFYDSGNGYDGNQVSPFPRSYDLTVRAKF